MSSSYTHTEAAVMEPFYKCEPHVDHTLRSVKSHLHQLCSQHANRLVKVETIDGDVFEGYIVHCHKSILCIRLSNEGCSRAFLPGPVNPYNNVILPLVLFDLLAITLL
ncbi:MULTISPECIES: hypothetical protein [unclassified Paenibacillus]|uniref:hypothetical protein n=1 Tax=unclassified Paenibacillus TaxID=185978 RepID=UPI00095500BD|nr:MULTISPECIES: hypothetical protein [unclassified Paenibacillus]SIR61037.1 hypothetical protein SAMN05880555_4431 [Paenibacillus sp. RU4X]SIR69713.1 hypothetical protein SAMN05880570_4433 [Paenibacillus sp. RU4T]